MPEIVQHPWNLTADEARQLQNELRSKVVRVDAIRIEELRLVTGVDNAYRRAEAETTAYACAVTLSFPGLEVVEQRYAVQPVAFPYVPGLLSFRESPAMLAACQDLEQSPDVFLVDAHGYAHPRRMGAASHLGLLLGKPTIGCAKSKLVGRYVEPGHEFGDWTPLTDHGEVIGAAVRTRPSHSPLFVSIGHMISLETAIKIVLACCKEENFLPEPARLAHHLVTEYKKENGN